MSLVAPLQVLRTRRLSPSFMRVELGGEGLSQLGVTGPTYDQRIALLLQEPGAPLPRLGADTWWQDFRTLPPHARGHLRTYTLRRVCEHSGSRTIVVDFVLHPGDHGPGSAWAQRAEPGDQLVAILPRAGEAGIGIEWPAERTSEIVLAGDETAVPAICSILSALPAHTTGRALLEVPAEQDHWPLEAPPGIAVSWLPRDGRPVGTRLLEGLGSDAGGHTPTGDAAARPEAPGRGQRTRPGEGEGGEGQEPDEQNDDLWETPTYSSSGEALEVSPSTGASYVWLAGETGMVGQARRRLRALGLTRHQMSCMGYWRHGRAMPN